MVSKICIDCGAEKTILEFYKHPKMRDGYFNSCKNCRRAYEKKNRIDHLEVKREYDRKRNQTPERKARKRVYSDRWYDRHPERYQAHVVVSNALRDGRIERKLNCEKCGSPEHLHKHHYDYSKPLDVMWLCARCHARI